jgi:putative zinc binding protein
LKLREDGCALCGSTWGNYWEELEGARRFFCCELCARQLRHLVARVRDATGWSDIEALEIVGDRRGREVTVRAAGRSERFGFVFGYDGEVRRFRPIPPA